MSKMGIAVISSYRGGYNFEAVGLSRTLVAEFFPGMPSRISGIGLPAPAGRRAAPARLGRGLRGPAGRRLLQGPPRRARRTPSRRG
jgi:glutamate synthase (NADPH/NADH) large chain